MIDAMPPGRRFDHFAMMRPRSRTRRSASAKLSASAAAAAENCPKLCPDTTDGLIWRPNSAARSRR
jgi:hypothetical protein